MSTSVKNKSSFRRIPLGFAIYGLIGMFIKERRLLRFYLTSFKSSQSLVITRMIFVSLVLVHISSLVLWQFCVSINMLLND